MPVNNDIVVGDKKKTNKPTDSTSWLDDAGKTLGSAVMTAVHGVSQGTFPKLVRAANALNPTSNIKGEDAERMAMESIEQARSDAGALGAVTEFAGNMATPMPGLGVAAGAGRIGLREAAKLGSKELLKRTGKGLAEAGIKGAAQGALSAGLGSWGETQTEDLDAESLAKATGKGALYGGAGGALMHGAGELLRARAPSARYSAAGADAGQIRSAADKSMSRLRGLDKDAESLERLELEHGVIGKPFRTSKGVVTKSAEMLNEQGERLNKAFQDMDDAATKLRVKYPVQKFHDKGMEKVDDLLGAVKKVDPVTGAVTREYPGISSTKLKALEEVLGEARMFQTTEKVMPSEIWKRRRELDDVLFGPRGNDRLSSFKDEILSAYRRGVNETLDNNAQVMSGRGGLPSDFGANFRKMNEMYGDAKLANRFGVQGLTADEGKFRFLGGVQGITGAMAGSGALYAWNKFAPESWKQDPVLAIPAAAVAGNFLGRRGAAANIELGVGRFMSRYAPATQRFGARTGGMIARDDAGHVEPNEAFDRMILKQGADRKKINFTPRSPLNHD